MTLSLTQTFKMSALTIALSALLAGCSSDSDTPKTQKKTPDVTITPPTEEKNTAPTLTLSAPSDVSEGSIVYISLNANDTDNDLLTYSWQQTSGVAVAAVLENDKVKLNIPLVTEQKQVTFSVSVNDGKSVQVTKDVSLTIYPLSARPTVVVDPDQVVNGGVEVVLAGNAKDDEEITSLEWKHVSTPNEEVITLNQQKLGVATFSAPEIGFADPLVLTFALSAKDNKNFVSQEQHLVTVMPSKTEVTIAHQGTREGRTEFELELSVKSHLSNESLVFDWKQINKGPKIWIRQTDNGHFSAVTPNVQENTDYLIQLTVTDDFNRETITEFGLTVTPSTSIVEKSNLRLNDTGVNVCANEGGLDFSTGWPPGNFDNNQLDCNLTADENDNPIPQGQDGHYGRDTDAREGILVKVGSGDAAFDFTKLDETGQPLADDAQHWSCVKDNHTGVIWEVKTNSGLQNATNTYTWYNSNNIVNGGHPGYEDGGNCIGSQCDTRDYVKKVNEAAICGLTNWRMPDRNELLSIVHFGVEDDALMIDADFFPHTQPGTYWSGQAMVGEYRLDAFESLEAFSFNFGGGLHDHIKSYKNHVRLVSTETEQENKD